MLTLEPETMPVSIVRQERLDGNIESVRVKDRFVTLRFGRDPYEFAIFHIPKNCFIHCNGNPMPLRDVQFCDSVSVWFQKHPRFDVCQASEIEIC